MLKNTSDIEIRSFSGRQGQVNVTCPAIFHRNISEGLIAESKVKIGFKTFFGISNAEIKKVILRNNDTRKDDKAVSYYP